MTEGGTAAALPLFFIWKKERGKVLDKKLHPTNFQAKYEKHSVVVATCIVLVSKSKAFLLSHFGEINIEKTVDSI